MYYYALYREVFVAAEPDGFFTFRPQRYHLYTKHVYIYADRER